jgi:hypothetical protein
LLSFGGGVDPPDSDFEYTERGFMLALLKAHVDNPSSSNPIAFALFYNSSALRYTNITKKTNARIAAFMLALKLPAALKTVSEEILSYAKSCYKVDWEVGKASRNGLCWCTS